MEESKWMIVKRETTSTKIKKYFKNIFDKIFNRKRKDNKQPQKSKQKEITIELLY